MSTDSKTVQGIHLNNLATTKRQAEPMALRAKHSVPLAFWNFTLNGIRGWLFTLLTSPGDLFQSWISSAVALFLYPAIWLGLLVCVAIFVIGDRLGLGTLITNLGKKWANGYSIINWPNKDIFDKTSTEAINAARAMLEGKYETTIPPTISNDTDVELSKVSTQKLFSTSLARALLLMSAIVYERDDSFVEQASYLAQEARTKMAQGPEGVAESEKLWNDARGCLKDSEKVIHEKAVQWGLEYDGVSDLATTGGPFASIFYSKASHNPFIVLVFKGTGPQNFAEFLVDCALNRIPAGVFFDQGTAHQGFYTDLFMITSTKSQGSDGYGSIVSALKHTAGQMKQELAQSRPDLAQVKIPLWVTGHSLGSALASLCYARFLQSTSDLGQDLALRDCYSFGNPRLGDGDFASAFEKSLLKPLGRENILWRVQNNSDIVGHVPPGLCDDETKRNLSPLSTLNYAHLGPCLVLRPAAPRYSVECQGSFHSVTQVTVTGDNYNEALEKNKVVVGDSAAAGRNPLTELLELILPGFVYDHFPSRYLVNLNRVASTVN